MEIISFAKNKMKLLTKKSSKNYIKMQKPAIFVKTSFKINMWKIKDIVKLEIIVIIQGNIEMLRITYVIRNIGYIYRVYL